MLIIPYIKATSGNPIIKINASVTPFVPKTVLIKRVAPLISMLLSIARAAKLIILIIMSVKGIIAAARNNPMISVHIASMLAIIRVNAYNGIWVISLLSNPNFIPHNLEVILL